VFDVVCRGSIVSNPAVPQQKLRKTWWFWEYLMAVWVVAAHWRVFGLFCKTSKCPPGLCWSLFCHFLKLFSLLKSQLAVHRCLKCEIRFNGVFPNHSCCIWQLSRQWLANAEQATNIFRIFVVLAVFRRTQLILENLPGPVLVWSQQNYLKLLLTMRYFES